MLLQPEGSPVARILRALVRPEYSLRQIIKKLKGGSLAFEMGMQALCRPEYAFSLWPNVAQAPVRSPHVACRMQPSERGEQAALGHASAAIDWCLAIGASPSADTVGALLSFSECDDLLTARVFAGTVLLGVLAWESAACYCSEETLSFIGFARSPKS